MLKQRLGDKGHQYRSKALCVASHTFLWCNTYLMEVQLTLGGSGLGLTQYINEKKGMGTATAVIYNCPTKSCYSKNRGAK